jgi:hypothetical protein
MKQRNALINVQNLIWIECIKYQTEPGVDPVTLRITNNFLKSIKDYAIAFNKKWISVIESRQYSICYFLKVVVMCGPGIHTTLFH